MYVKLTWDRDRVRSFVRSFVRSLAINGNSFRLFALVGIMSSLA
jgi:hypothetical protein